MIFHEIRNFVLWANWNFKTVSCSELYISKIYDAWEFYSHTKSFIFLEEWIAQPHNGDFIAPLATEGVNLDSNLETCSLTPLLVVSSFWKSLKVPLNTGSAALVCSVLQIISASVSDSILLREICLQIVFVLPLFPLTRHCGSEPERGYNLGLENVAKLGYGCLRMRVGKYDEGETWTLEPWETKRCPVIEHILYRGIQIFRVRPGIGVETCLRRFTQLRYRKLQVRPSVCEPCKFHSHGRNSEQVLVLSRYTNCFRWKI